MARSEFVAPLNGDLELGLLRSATQLTVLSRRLGRFRWWIGPAQPVLMTAFAALFGRSAWHRFGRRRTHWKGRTIALGRAPRHATSPGHRPTTEWSPCL